MVLFIFALLLGFCYSQGYSFQHTIVIKNTGPSLNTTDVVIKVNTFQLIYDGFMLDNCEDVKFVIVDTTEEKNPIEVGLRYFLEGGCGKKDTRFWVKVPRLEGGDGITEVLMVHGSALSSSQSSEVFYMIDPQRKNRDFEGEWIINTPASVPVDKGGHMKEPNCDYVDDYELVEEFHNGEGLFVRGASSAFISAMDDASEMESGSRAHSHEILPGKFDFPMNMELFDFNTEGETPPAIIAVPFTDGSGMYSDLASFNHTHDHSDIIMTEEDVYTPCFRTVNFCKSPSLEFNKEMYALSSEFIEWSAEEYPYWGINGDFNYHFPRGVPFAPTNRRDSENVEGSQCHKHVGFRQSRPSGGTGDTERVFSGGGNYQGTMAVMSGSMAYMHYMPISSYGGHPGVQYENIEDCSDPKPPYTHLYNYKLAVSPEEVTAEDAPGFGLPGMIFMVSGAEIPGHDPEDLEEPYLGWEPVDMINDNQLFIRGTSSEDTCGKIILHEFGDLTHNHAGYMSITAVGDESGSGSATVVGCTELDDSRSCEDTHSQPPMMASIPVANRYHKHVYIAEESHVSFADNVPEFRYAQFVRRKDELAELEVVVDYESLKLLEWLCYGELARDPLVCSGNGACDQADYCICRDVEEFNYHGVNCQEFIPGTGFYSDKNTINIVFEVPVKWIPLNEETSVDCSARLHPDSVKRIGKHATCRWKTKDMLNIGWFMIENSLPNIGTVKIRPLTSYETIIPEDLNSDADADARRQSNDNDNDNDDRGDDNDDDDGKPEEEEEEEYMTEDGYVIVRVTAMETIWSAYWEAFVFVPSGLLLLGVLLACCVFVGILCVCVQMVRLKKYKEISKDVDLLLKEQQAEELESGTKIAELRINKNLFEVDYDDIKVMKKIGEGGSSSVVFKCKWKGKIIAFKCFKTQNICSTQDKFSEFEREVQILSSAKHPNILQFFGATLKPPRVGILMLYCENGDIKEFLTKYLKEKKKSYAEKEKLRVVEEIASAMVYLHSSKIIHRDLKNENVLMDKNEESKLMDFGLSKVVERISQTKTKRIGTSVYMAPEVTRGDDYTEKCDVFSYAIMVLEIMEDNFNLYGENAPYNLEFKVASNANFRPEIDMALFHSCKYLAALVKSCWAHEPELRPTFKEVLENIQSNKSFALGGNAIVSVDISPLNKKVMTKDEILVEMEKVSVENDKLETDITAMKQQLGVPLLASPTDADDQPGNAEEGM